MRGDLGIPRGPYGPDKPVERSCLLAVLWVGFVRFGYSLALMALDAAGWTGPTLHIGSVVTAVLVASLVIRVMSRRGRKERQLSAAARRWHQRQGVRR